MKLNKYIGTFAIIIALISSALSAIPGAFSIVGAGLAAAAIVISCFSATNGRSVFFYITLGISFMGIFFINDGLRIWGALDIPFNIKSVLYLGFFSISIVGIFTVQALRVKHMRS